MGKTSPWTYPAAAFRVRVGGCQWLDAIAGGRCARRRWCFSMRSAARHSSCGAGSPVFPGQPFEQVVDLGACRFTKRKPRLALDIAGDDAAVLQDMLAHGKPDAELLLVADQRKMRVEQVVRLLAPACRRQVDQFGQHVREAVAGHRPVGAAFRLEIEEHAAIAAEDGKWTQATRLLHGAEL